MSFLARPHPGEVIGSNHCSHRVDGEAGFSRKRSLQPGILIMHEGGTGRRFDKRAEALCGPSTQKVGTHRVILAKASQGPGPLVANSIIASASMRVIIASENLPAEQPVHPRSAPLARLLGRCQILGRGLARLAVGDRFELDLLAFSERAHIGAFNRADMDEYVLASVFRLNEAESLLGVEEFNCSNLHDMTFK
jgi:hypothetical protein